MEKRETDIFSGNIVNKNGIVTRWPKKLQEKTAVLKYIRSKIEKAKVYTEKEINEIIDKWHSFGDHALIRREMYDHYLLERTEDGRKYWIIEQDN
jgi:hypothetical protein